MQKDTILTGIRSNDELTLGNYIGAILPMVRLQQELAGSHQINMFIPDLHSFTTPIDHSVLYDNVLKGFAYYVAAGLDLEQPDTFIYRQSYISAHAELTWILDCFTYYGEMTRMTQFKDKSAQHQGNITVGLLNYPVLMAADILLYNAKWVPVGDDQTQHLEITRDIAQRLNHKFADIFPDGVFVVPEEVKKQVAFKKQTAGGRVMSLTDPTKKMSKSLKDPKGTILLSDEPAAAAKKVMSATTDSEGVIHYDTAKQPGVSNLLEILAVLSGQPLESVVADWTGKDRYGDLKKAVATAVEEFLSGFQQRYHQIDTQHLIKKLEQDEAAMRSIANATLLRAQRAVGLRPRE
ncbi:MAG TPA: tryptophan--tRNA ligase [Verrucomicrobiae bacterium]|nr:tryptophan--tRNA ligase [Verrucomicrobiae bacterium]